MSQFLRNLDLGERAADPRFSQSWATVQSAARASVESPMQGSDVTDRLCGWGHNYGCPEHGGKLDFREDQPNVHHCSAGDHNLHGEQFDTGWAYERNIRLQAHLNASAVAAAAQGPGVHSERAVTILSQIATLYQSIPLHGNKVGQAKLMHQSLEEAVAACTLARSFELVEQFMTEQQRELIRTELFAPMVQVIQDHLMYRTHNIEVWHLAGIASLAVALRDPELAKSTLEGEHGFLHQLADGVRADGWWFEGAPGYHFYTLTAALNGVEAYQALGLPQTGAEVLEQMLLTPIEMARNDLTVPAYNDNNLENSVPPGMTIHADLYYRGAKLCPSDAVDRFLSSQLSKGFDRSTIAHFVYAEPRSESAPGDGWPIERKSRFDASGYAVLRQPHAQDGQEPDTCLYVKYGPHGEGHGQADKLQIDLMIDGERVISEPGTDVYTNPIHDSWYVQTWSHSTLMVDRAPQPAIAGTLLGHQQVATDAIGVIDTQVVFGDEPDQEALYMIWQIFDPALTAAYAGVTMRRVLAMAPPELGNYLLDIMLVGSDRRRTLDLITHVRGQDTGKPGRPTGRRFMIPEFRGVRHFPESGGDSTYELTDSGKSWSRTHTGADEVMTALTPSNPPHETCATTIQRVTGTQAAFISAMPLGDVTVSGITRADDGTVQVTVDGQQHLWHFGADLQPDPAAKPWTVPPISLQIND